MNLHKTRDKNRSFGAFVPANTQAPVLALSLTKCFVNLQVHFHDLALNKGERFLVETWNNIASEWWPLSGKSLVRRLTADVEHCFHPQGKLRARVDHLGEEE